MIFGHISNNIIEHGQINEQSSGHLQIKLEEVDFPEVKDSLPKVVRQYPLVIPFLNIQPQNTSEIVLAAIVLIDD